MQETQIEICTLAVTPDILYGFYARDTVKMYKLPS